MENLAAVKVKTEPLDLEEAEETYDRSSLFFAALTSRDDHWSVIRSASHNSVKRKCMISEHRDSSDNSDSTFQHKSRRHDNHNSCKIVRATEVIGQCPGVQGIKVELADEEGTNLTCTAPDSVQMMGAEDLSHVTDIQVKTEPIDEFNFSIQNMANGFPMDATVPEFGSDDVDGTSNGETRTNQPEQDKIVPVALFRVKQDIQEEVNTLDNFRLVETYPEQILGELNENSSDSSELMLNSGLENNLDLHSVQPIQNPEVAEAGPLLSFDAPSLDAHSSVVGASGTVTIKEEPKSLDEDDSIEIDAEKLQNDNDPQCILLSTSTDLAGNLMDIKPTELYVCLICGTGYSHKDYLKHHIIRHSHSGMNRRDDHAHLETHASDAKAFQCKICNEPFAKSTELLIHWKAHKKEAKRTCTVCGIVFTSTGELKNHRDKCACENTLKTSVLCLNAPSLDKESPALGGSATVTIKDEPKSSDEDDHIEVDDHLQDTCVEQAEYNGTEQLQYDDEQQLQYDDAQQLQYDDAQQLQYDDSQQLQYDDVQQLQYDDDDDAQQLQYDNDDAQQLQYDNDDAQQLQNDDDDVQQLQCDDTEQLNRPSTSTDLAYDLMEFKPAEAKPYVCLICGKGCSQKGNLKRHILNHSHQKFDSTAKECPMCHKIFGRRDYYQAHLKTHTSEGKSFQCKFCNEAFAQSNELLIHWKTHSGEKEYKCAQCGIVCPSGYALHDHMVTHTSQKEMPFQCKVCDQYFALSTDLAHHWTTSHKVVTLDKPFVCAVCGKAYAYKSSLHLHAKSHPGQKPYTCPQCGEGFEKNQYLIVHIQHAHRKYSSCVCSQCGVVFRHKSELDIHKLEHKAEDKTIFRCSLCPKFLSATDLPAHMKTHADVIAQAGRIQKAADLQAEKTRQEDVTMAERIQKNWKSTGVLMSLLQGQFSMQNNSINHSTSK